MQQIVYVHFYSESGRITVKRLENVVSIVPYGNSIDFETASENLEDDVTISLDRIILIRLDEGD